MLFLMAATEPAFPLVLRYLIDSGFGSDHARALWLVPLSIVAIFMVRGIASFISFYLMNSVELKILAQIRNSIFERILDVPISLIERDQGAQTINLMMQEARKLTAFITTFTTGILRNLLTIILLIAYLLYLNWQLSLVTFLMVPFIALTLRVISRRLRRLNMDLMKVNQDMIGLLQEVTQGNQVVRIFGGQAHERSRLNEQNSRFRGAFLRIAIANGLATPLTQLFAATAVIVVIVVSLLQVSHGATAGEFISFITALLMILSPLKQVAEANNLFQQCTIAAEAIFSVIDTPSEDNTGAALHQIRGNLSFQKVSFAYPNSTNLALDQISFEARAGQTIALVGASGSGKSSLMNLLPRFHLPQSGQILLDGIDIATLKLTDFRQHIAIVSQHVVLFNDTLKANICYGRQEIDSQRLEQAIDDAYLRDVVADLPLGIDTVLGNNGMLLSGGQRQRVAIARALYKNAPLLLLDEATSALDSQSERYIQDALTRLMKNRTTLVVAHRLSTIERADMIVVMSQGRVLEMGQHEQLLKQQGAYAQLYHLQFAT